MSLFLFFAILVLLRCWRCIQCTDGDRVKAERLSATHIFALCRGIDSELGIPDLLFIIVQELTPLPLDMSMDTLIIGRDSPSNVLYCPLWSCKCKKTIHNQLALCNRNVSKNIVFTPKPPQSGEETVYLLQFVNLLYNKTQWLLLYGTKKMRESRDAGLCNVIVPVITFTYNALWSDSDRGCRATWIVLRIRAKEASYEGGNDRLEVGWDSNRCRMTHIRQFVVPQINESS